MTFHIGQKVVCVDNVGNHYLCMDEVYVVAGFGLTPLGNNGIFIEGAAQRSHNDEAGRPSPFYMRRFRPAVECKTDISIFTEMLTKTGVNA